MEGVNVDQLSDGNLRNLNESIGQHMKGDCVFIDCSIRSPLDDEFRIVIEEIKGKSENNHLIALLETSGGHMETVERIVSVMRSHYEEVSFVIPNYAYSAGTVLALSGDRIYMDYYSVLGPIDPQYQDENGNVLPGVGYLEKFRELTKKINESESSPAELAFLVNKFDPALLFQIEQGVDHGVSLITEWLPKYKFKNWKKTQSKKKKVTKETKIARAKNIAKILGDPQKWHSHGRGISMRYLTNDEIKLKIDDFGNNEELNDLIRHYHALSVDYYSRKLRVSGYIHSVNGIRRVL